MTTITFDTHKFIRTLKEAGIPEGQAEAFSEAFKEAQGEADLATKRDIDDVRHDMVQLEQRLIIKLGSMMVVAIGIVAVLVKLL
ncbi:CCDC90 family protein [Methylobacter sp. S3L5C]|uniref:CCDC90 family protein n=1 Tax=Methylobacter sp. S3L5C TaxID=2839024 RepID=UPI001FAD94A9|nr:CCDC90 family protein [Methylobacter sp. S3L5C]UOA08350.1 CCDC90 family protein [Methylobacter sp. S3L5C]